jgi:exosortase/archaeosortase family protein
MIAPAEFVIKVLLVYGGWKVFHYAATHYTILAPFWKTVSDFMASVSIKIASVVLSLAGESNTYNKRNLIIDGTPGIFVADHCIGLAPMVVFSFLILFFTGKIQNKLWFIPLGNLLILLINALRVAGLAYTAAHYSAGFFEINHSLIYVVLTYGTIFLLVVWWMNQFYQD